ncbi:MAG: 4Fe-4S dicluster domain-containing protein [Candidatus Bathyarchaeota archaeon]|nr:4Fe-4S dicluster domain-containing protein [Candidatus Bathyarchaeota archaeon]
MNEDEHLRPDETYEGIPRNKIPWYPIIDYEKCINCGKCVEYCAFGVYEFEEKDGKKKSIVKNPYNCTPVFCRGCEEICPAGAITHPSEEETQKIIDKLKKEKA